MIKGIFNFFKKFHSIDFILFIKWRVETLVQDVDCSNEISSAVVTHEH